MAKYSIVAPFSFAGGYYVWAETTFLFFQRDMEME
jgi:hypothetical protein